MLIKKIKLLNYRNYSNEEINFCKDVNILYGDNAQGKTNVLESIFLCGTARSHQGSKDREIIKIGEEEAHIKMFIEKEGLEHKIDMHLKKNKSKGIAINGIPIKKLSELVGFVNMIFFSPEDLNLIKNGPSERRRFMDTELCQLNKIYLDNLKKYNKVLDQRNRLLKQIKYDQSLIQTLQAWDYQLIAYGRKIISARNEFINQIKIAAEDTHCKLTGNREKLVITYDPDVSEEEFEEKLEKSVERDINYQTTHVGPHRDDIKFDINGLDIRTYGSQGQKRTAALSLKLSEIAIVKKRIEDVPILLLDDVLSELDRNRQNYLLDCLDGIQTIITCTGMEEFVDYRNRLPFTMIYKVVNGKVFDEKGR